MIHLTIAENLQFSLEEPKLVKILQNFLEILGHAERELSIYFTDDDEIQKLNHSHRGLNKPTDILSWSYWEDDPNSEILGELAVSIDRIRLQAQLNGWDEETELIRILAHGCVHLIGYDHERSSDEEQKMLSIEVDLLNHVGLRHIYPASHSE